MVGVDHRRSGSLMNFLANRLGLLVVTRRMEIELTSRLDDGRFTWRAAGARQPKGTLDAAMVPEGAVVGEVFRAEVESGLDGVDVQSIAPRKVASPLDPRGEAIRVIGSPQPEPGVQVILASKGKGRRPDSAREDRTGRTPRGSKDRGRAAGPERGRGDRARPVRPVADGARAETQPPTRGGPARRDQPGRRPPASRRPGDQRGDPRGDRRGQELPVSTVHRNALLATLRPEQLPVAEQLLRGGLPAVRQAIDEQNRAALAQSRPTTAPETILAIADDLLPLTTLAAWKDRAAAVHAAGPTVKLRDLRPVVTAARTVTLDEEARGVLKELQGLLHTKVQELRTQWVSRIEGLLKAGQVAEALGVVARPPDPATRCPAELAASLTDAAGAAMVADLTSTSWIALLDAVVASPMRRTVKPAGIPAGDEAQAAAIKAAGHVPALAKLLGMRIPPPPPPSPAKRPALSGRRSS